MTDGSDLLLPLNSQELKSLLDLSAPYIGRIFAILRHSNINLKILESHRGNEFVKNMQEVS